MTDTLRAGPQTRITLHFAVRLMDGTEMDSTYGGEPAAFSWGDESLLPGFERAILGLKAGDKRSVFIDAASGFGEYN
ncbi:MAG TPA: peptidylprolyl isomerase, partial [Alcanivorax sp.]|nr:peptidylprolyl isomerase [Alcanivorax sp.]HBS13726.1 peptidylprolyl isomerase [Alcanivorax sp.]HCM65635.1 peptidylprolyl isomerase [Alcanivorax sp.]HCQ35069.1 peptidylprolyl isomerase [Alcanivorax sp.]